MTASLTWDINDLARVIGEVPAGDAPAAWWLSLHPDVQKAYEAYRVQRQAWGDRLTELCQAHGLPPRPMMAGIDGGQLIGIIPDPGMKPPQWWRVTKDNLLVPRKRTKAEKEGEVLRRWLDLNRVPTPVEYLPGMPNTVWGADQRAYSVHIRRSPRQGSAVLAFVGSDPDTAKPRFEPDGHWHRMKLSTFYELRELQTGQPSQIMEKPKPGILGR
jgi:hypothetical protein